MSDTISQTGFRAPDPAHLADLFPGYDITRLIACGGMGAVYEAVQRSLDRAVAIKILPREFTADAAFREGFEAEAKAMARLNHPNLIGVYDFGEVDGMLYIIMEYVPGQSLFHLAAGKPLDPCEAARLLASVCRGLAHAHENGIIHRDIKPANILLDAQIQPKIGDFGLARPLERKVLEGEAIFGTPGYTAPEVLDNPQSIDHRADIFSLGVMLHELLTGKLPMDDPRPPSAVTPCDPRFDALVRKATHPTPAARHASAADLAVELDAIASSAGRRVLQTAASVGRRPAIGPRTKPVPRKSSNGPVIAVLVVAVLFVGALILFINNSGSKPDPGVAITNGADILPITPAPSGNPNPANVAPPPATRPVAPEPPPSSDHPDSGPEPGPVSHVEVDLPDGTRVINWSGATSEWTPRDDGSSDFEVLSRDIWETRDNAAFRHTTWSGDGVFMLHVSGLSDAYSWAKAGLMVRESLDDDARHAFIAKTPSQGSAMLVRSAKSGITTMPGQTRGEGSFLRITRSGDTLAGAISRDGVSWENVGDPVNIPGFSRDVFVGFAACSHRDNDDRPLRGSVGALVTRSDAPDPDEVDEFFTRARTIMSERCVPVIADYDAALQANVREFDRSFRRINRRLGDGFRDAAEIRLQRLLGEIANAKNRMPESIGEDLSLVPGSLELHESALSKQNEIDEKLAASLNEQTAVYIVGLERQVERFVEDNNPGAADFVRAEIRRTREDPHHFGRLMMDPYPLDEQEPAGEERRRRRNWFDR